MLSYFSDDGRRCNFGGADFGYSPDYKYQKNCIQGGVNVNLHALTGSPREGDMPWQHFPTYRTFGNESWKFPGRGSETWQRTSWPVDHYISPQQTRKDYRSVSPHRSSSPYSPFAYHRSSTPREIPRHSSYNQERYAQKRKRPGDDKARKHTKVKQDLGRQFRKNLNEGTLNQVVDDKTKGVGSGSPTSSPPKSDCLVVTGSSNTDKIVPPPNSSCPHANDNIDDSQPFDMEAWKKKQLDICKQIQESNDSGDETP